MKVEYTPDKNVAFCDGYKFRRDRKTGYYLATRKTDGQHRERLHCYVWRVYNGEIPSGYHVHHMDCDKSNNDISNLKLVDSRSHVEYHARKNAVEHYDAICENLKENAAPKAAEWHGSEAGRLWHSQHARKTMENLKESEFVCACCGKHFFSKPVGRHKFCSNACRTRARVKSGVDNETRICAVCGGEFIANRYSAKRCCTAECSLKLRKGRERSENRERACL